MRNSDFTIYHFFQVPIYLREYLLIERSAMKCSVVQYVQTWEEHSIIEPFFTITVFKQRRLLCYEMLIGWSIIEPILTITASQ